MHLFRFFFCSFLSCLILTSTTLQVSASSEDLYKRSGVAGVYFRIPFGAPEPEKSGPQYGLRLSMEQTYARRTMWEDPSLQFNPQLGRARADVLALNFNSAGFDNLSLAGRPALVLDNAGILRAAEDEEDEGGTSTFTYILAVIGGLTLIAIVIDQAGGDD